MQFLPFILFLLLRSITAFIKFPITKHLDSFEIDTSLGNSNQTIRFALDFQANYTLYWDSHYPSTSKSTLKRDVDIFLSKGLSISTQEVKDSFSLVSSGGGSNVGISNYPFFYYEDKADYSLMTPHLIGMSYSSINSTYSLVHQLKQLGLITSQSFSIVKDKHYKKYLCFGGIDLGDKLTPYQSSCLIQKSASNWACSISSVSLTKHSRLYKYTSIDNSNDRVSFSSATTIYAPKAFIDFYLETIISDGLKEEQCHVYGVNNKKYIKCYEQYISQMGSVVFQIDGYDYSFPFYSGWSCFDGSCDFDIMENPYDKREWVLGGVFFDQLEVLFDHDNSQISFYSARKVMERSDQWFRDAQLFLMSVVAVIGLIGGGLMWLNKKRYKAYRATQNIDCFV